MKKISVLLLALMMLFAFTACDDNPNDETPDVPMDTLTAIFKAVISDVTDTLIPYTEGDVSVEGYEVSYKYTATVSSAVVSDWTVEVNATKEGADSISFIIKSEDLGKTIDVTIGENTYPVAANDIKGDTIISGFVGDDDEEEKTPLAN